MADDQGSLKPVIFANPFVDLLRIEGSYPDAGTARTVIEQRPELSNIHGAMHGGVIMTLLDVTMARAAISKRNFTDSVVSIGVSVNFTRPGLGRLVTEARVTGGGKSTCFCEAEVRDSQGELVAKGLGTFKYCGPKPSPLQAPGSCPVETIE